MKKYLLFICLTILIVACKKTESSKNGLEGTWLLKKSYSDPGDGSGKYVDVPKNSNYTLLFTSDGLVISNTSFFNLNLLKSYTLIDSNKIEFTFVETYSQSKITYNYQLKADTLTLNPLCIEGCGLKFIRK